MWRLYTVARSFSQRPSDLVGIEEQWLALQFDGAVALVGVTIEGALQETMNVGTKDKPEWKPKYTLGQLLSDDFRLPAPERPKGGIEGLKAFAGKGVKIWKVQK